MTARTQKPPAHLSDSSKRWWRQVTKAHELEPHHAKQLEAACTAWDRMQAARERLAKDGLFVADRFGQTKAHPAIGVERDARIGFLRALRELALDVTSPDDPRPPRGRGY